MEKGNTRLSSKAQGALAILKSGGYFRCALESAFYGGEQFQMRLRAADGSTVKGYGHATHLELQAAGLLVRRDCASSSAWPQEWAAQMDKLR